jgi:GTP pyrophosphokinase
MRSGRHSIYQKMGRRARPLEEMYDLLGLVHKICMPIEGRFKDYIAMPKSNRYQSLHPR